MASHRNSNGGSFSTKFIVEVPPGRLGLYLVDSLKGGTMISMVNEDSPLAGSLERGDQLISINGIDVHENSVADVSAILQKQSTMGRKITVARSATEINSSHSNKVLNNTQLGSTHATSTQFKNQLSGINHVSRSDNHHHSSSKHQEKHHPGSHSSHKKNKFDLIVDNVDDDAAPVPTEMKYDEFLDKRCDFPRKKHHHHSSPKSHRTHSNRSKETKNRNIDLNPDEDIAPVPAAMEFDESLDKRGAGKPHHGHRVRPVELSYSEDSPPAPCTMTHDDSIEKAKSKSSRCTERTYTNSTSQPSARHTPPSCLEVPSPGDEISTISSSTFKNAPSGIHYGRPVSTSGSYHRREPAQQQMPADSYDDVEERRLESSISDASEDILADAQAVYDAELVSPEEPRTPNVVVNVHSQNGEPSLKNTRRQWYENKCVIGSIVLVILVVVGVIVGVAVSLPKSKHDEPTQIQVQTGDSQIGITNAITLTLPSTDELAKTYYCGSDWDSVNADCSSANPCPSGSHLDCGGFEEFCIPFTNCGETFKFASDPSVLGGGPNVYDVMSTFYCAPSNRLTEQNCADATPCPNGSSDCKGDDEECVAFTLCNVEVSPETFLATSDSKPAKTTTTSSSVSMSTVYDSTVPNKESQSNLIEASIPSQRDTGHDTCMSAVPIIDLPAKRTGTTVTTIANFPEDFSCGLSEESRGVWYSFESQTKGVIKIEYQLYSKAKGSSILTVFEGSCSSDLENNCDWNESSDHPPYQDADNDLLVDEHLVQAGSRYMFFLTGERAETVGEYKLEVIRHPTPPNDECEDAIEVTSFPSFLKGSCTGATPDTATETAAQCGNIEYYLYEYVFHGVWYKLIGRGTLIDLKYQAEERIMVAVLAGSCENLECIRGYPKIDGEYLGQYNFHAEQDKTYWLLLSTHDWRTSAKEFDLNITEYDLPGNYLCQEAITFETSTQDTYSTWGYSTGATPHEVDTSILPVGCSMNGKPPGAGVWYRFLGHGAIVQIEYKLGSEYGTVNMAIFTGECDSLKCVPNTSVDYEDCTDDSCVITHELVAENGTVYSILLTGYAYTGQFSGGDFSLAVLEIEIPDGGVCKTAIEIGVFPFNDSGSTSEASPALNFGNFFNDLCGVGGDSFGVWYTLAGKNKIIIISYDAYWASDVFLFSGPCSMLVCEDGFVHGEKVKFTAVKGKTYSVYLSGTIFGYRGDYDLQVSEIDPPINDLCASPVLVGEFPFTAEGDLAGAMPDFNVTWWGCGGDEWGGVWYEFLGDGMSHSLTLELMVEQMDARCQIIVFEGSCDNLRCVEYEYKERDKVEVSIDNFATTTGVKYMIHILAEGVSFKLPYQLDVI